MTRGKNIQPGDYSQDAATIARFVSIGTRLIASFGIAVNTVLIPLEAAQGEEIKDNLIDIAQLTLMGALAIVGCNLLEGYFQQQANELRQQQ